MPRRVPLPPALTAGPFRTRDAREAGITEGRLRGRDLEHPFHGAYSTAVAASVLDRCREFAPLLRAGDFFSHATAARLWNCPLPEEFAPDEVLHVSSIAPLTPIRRDGIIGHRIAAAEPVVRSGLAVSDAVSTWLGLATLVPRDERVAAADHLVLDPRVLDPRDIRPHTRIESLDRAVRDFHGRGARAAASALLDVRQGAESRPETLLRLLLIRAGLPEPELNVELRSEGSLLGYVDLFFRRYRVVVEYDGDGHRANARQYERDISRIDDIVAAGFSLVRVRKRGLFVTPQATVARVTRALSDRGWSSKARNPRNSGR
ncbi:hypothetical protein BH11ACT2_BH11ACT2_14150 [soil metagenome]